MKTERLLFFPFAGGAGETYLPWFKHIDQHIECQFVSLPGRGKLFNQPAIDNMADMVSYLLPQVVKLADKPLSFFGHSMGALIAFSLAHALKNKHQITLKHLFVSGHRAPTQPYTRDFLHLLNEKDLLKALRPMGGLAAMDEALISAFLPTLYADFKLCETCTPHHEKPLSQPTSVLWSDADDYIHSETITRWAQESTGPTQFYRFSGDHFFINHNQAKIADTINQQLLLSSKTELP